MIISSSFTIGPLDPPSRYVPFEEYLEREQRAEGKSEWNDGTVRAMAGVRPPHGFIESGKARFRARTVGPG